MGKKRKGKPAPHPQQVVIKKGDRVVHFNCPSRCTVLAVMGVQIKYRIDGDIKIRTGRLSDFRKV